MSNFADFYTRAIKDKNRKIKKGRYKGQSGSLKSKELKLPGPAYHPQPGRSDAPSASTFMPKG